MNGRIIVFSILSIFLIGIVSCKSEYEAIRTSGDATKIVEKAHEYFEKEEYIKAQSLYEIVVNSVKGTAAAEQIYYNYAQTHFQLKSHILAAYYFKTFSQTFPNSPLREEADFMRAFNNYKLSPSFRLDQESTKKAIQQFQLFANTYPNSPRLNDANNFIDELRVKLEEKAFDQAYLYYNLKQYQSATHAFENLIRDFPDSQDIERVRFLKAKAAYLLAENSVYTKQEERYEKAKEFGDRFVKKYDKSKYLKEVRNIIKDSNKKINNLSK